MQKIFQYIKTNFQQPNNGIKQIMLIHGIVFITLLLLKTILVITSYDVLYEQICQYLILPVRFDLFIDRPWTLLTHFLVYIDFFSILFNLWLLYTFGKFFKNFLGNKSLITLYILGGIAGGITVLLFYNLAPKFQTANTIMMGAAGSIYAIIMGLTVFAPQLTFRLFFFGSIKLKYITGALLLFTIFGLSSHHPVESIAQLGGALMGYLYIQQLKKGIDIGKYFFKTGEFLKNYVFQRKKHMKITYINSPSAKKNNTTKTAENKSTEKINIDAIIDKIADHGYESLTKEEKQALFNHRK